ncbi:MAG: CRP/FNR family transcriptional regulator [Glaciecola sp.]|jgi:CRP/FNR family transcriptional regulator
MIENLRQQLEDSYGFMFESELLDEIAEVSLYNHFKTGYVIMDYGQNVKSIPLLLDGAIKILRQDADGDELALYYLERGDTCSMTMTCCMGQQKSEIRAIAETETSFVSIPIEKMSEWMRKYSSWMAFVFESYNSRFNELLQAIDNLAFNNMHDRLNGYLKDQVLIKKSTVLELSHQHIAYDMNTSRVVVSRLLKHLEKEGKIKLGRNKIDVLSF